MADILHRVGIKSSRDAAYQALATRAGLAAWWTNDTRGESEVDGPKEWIGTKIRWDLREEDDYTIVNFKHEGWKEPVEFMHHCSTKWAVFLMSLKALVENGQGAPHPHDVKIDNWN